MGLPIFRAMTLTELYFWRDQAMRLGPLPFRPGGHRVKPGDG